jgi:hypothetical protein
MSNDNDSLLSLQDDPALREVYSDSVVGASFAQGNITLTLAVTRIDHAASAVSVRRVISRTVLPLRAALELLECLNRAIDDLETQGIIKRGRPLEAVR